MHTDLGDLPRNRLLSRLKPAERDNILKCMQLHDVDIKEPLYEANMPIERAFFPESGVMSIVTVADQGLSVEAITVGLEGMIGLPIILGANSTLTKAYCQIPGKIWSISAADLLTNVSASDDFSLTLRRYTQTVFDSMAQSTACNRLHSIEERCARWLLMTRDRMEQDTFQLTQEFLAMMLGVHRPGVSLVAKTLQKAGLIDYKHGKITIIDHAGLERVSCACYTIVKVSSEKLMNTPLSLVPHRTSEESSDIVFSN